MTHRNLLFIFTDEQRFDTLALAGNRYVQMPNVNRLAEQSCYFEETYCTEPVCTPSRSSIMSGLFPHATGASNNNLPMYEEVRCIPELLPEDIRRKYATGYHGKWHLGDEIFAQHGFDEWRSIEDYYYREHYTARRDRSARSTYSLWLIDQGFKPNLETTFSRERASTLPEPFGKPAYLANQASRFIRENSDRPFVLYVNFLEPHMPFFGPRTGMYDPATVPLPANFDHVPGADDSLRLRLFCEQYRRNGFEWYDLDSEAGWRQLIAAYYGLCTLIDHYTGKILATLSQCGLDQNTIVVFTSDHGDMMGSHRGLGKLVMYQEAARVPCMIRLPGQTHGQRITGPFSQIDLVPTLLELLGQPAPTDLHGKSIAPRLGGSDIQLNDDVLLQWNEPGESDTEQRPKDVPQWMIDIAGSRQRVMDAMTQPSRTIISADGWRCTINTVLRDHELFDLNKDRQERNNLAQRPEYQPKLAEQAERIRTWQRRVNDPLKLPQVREEVSYVSDR
jgi:arylsulfatase A-like enzyme